MVHRNITPSCILFDREGKAKLGGLCLQPNNETGPSFPSLVSGGLHYQAPEQFLGTAELTPGCDIYGLAACLYEALTGQPPVPECSSWMEQARAVCVQTVRSARELNPDVPAALDAVLMKALDKAPERRYQTPGQFREVLLSAASKKLTVA
jgi:serine/threonine-protein kinase